MEGQEPFARPPEFSSPEVTAEKKIVFRLLAPKANEVKVSAGDIPGAGQPIPLKKGANGIWEASLGPIAPGAYRYNFQVDGVTLNDPKNTQVSESNSNNWSLVIVPGSDLFDLKDVPHGAIAQVPYYSKTLKKFRRMHVYTPPGYNKGTETYPVFYLLHGAFDCDASWSTVGRAGLILDNLIATGKAKPMIVVMPAGHTGPFRFGPPGEGSFERQMEDFSKDFSTDLKPLIEKHYRTKMDRANRAIAGLSMGGAQTLNIAFANPEEYAYIGVFSSGIFGIAGGPNGTGPNKQWEDSHKEVLKNQDLKKGLKLLWFGIGKDDFLLQTSRATVDMLKSHNWEVNSVETDGGHTWIVWRDYLGQFAPKLFQD